MKEPTCSEEEFGPLDHDCPNQQQYPVEQCSHPACRNWNKGKRIMNKKLEEAAKSYAYENNYTSGNYQDDLQYAFEAGADFLLPLLLDAINILEEVNGINMRQYGNIEAIRAAAHRNPGIIQAELVFEALSAIKSQLEDK